jgi:Spy/CpxP family protein refolding chaperone
MMKRITTQVMIAVLLSAVPAVLLAQEPPQGPPEHRGHGQMRHGEFGGPMMGDPAQFADHHVKFMTKLLTLTDDQQKQATAIYTDAANAAKKLQEQMKAAHDSLRAAEKNKNAAAVDQSAVAIGNLTAQMMATHAKSNIAFSKILTPEQQAKLDKFQSERPEHMQMRNGPDKAPTN